MLSFVRRIWVIDFFHALHFTEGSYLVALHHIAHCGLRFRCWKLSSKIAFLLLLLLLQKIAFRFAVNVIIIP